MKIPFHAWILCVIVTHPPALQAQGALPLPAKLSPLAEDPSAYRKREEDKERASSLGARASEAARMENIEFSTESVTVSDPANRLLFDHEQYVTSFLLIAEKFGRGRMIPVLMSNPRLAMHGGVTAFHDPWNENGLSYALASSWGLIGDLGQPKPKAYLFRFSPALSRNTKDDATSKTATDIEESAINRFEEHALTLLQKGDKLVRWECTESMHAVGAIRAETQCLRCHDNHKAGDLLGAFTYSFTKSKAPAPDEKTKQILTLHTEGNTSLQIARALGWVQPDELDLYLIFKVRRVLLQHGIVTAEMLTDQARSRKQALEMDLGPLKKPNAEAGAE